MIASTALSCSSDQNPGNKVSRHREKTQQIRARIFIDFKFEIQNFDLIFFENFQSETLHSPFLMLPGSDGSFISS